MNKKDIRLSLIFTMVGLVSGALISYVQLLNASEEILSQVDATFGSVNIALIVGALQGAISTFIATFFGLKLARRLKLKLFSKLSKSNLIMIGLISFFTASFITFSDKFIFASYLPQEITTYKFSFLYLISSVLYGGIIEELLRGSMGTVLLLPHFPTTFQIRLSPSD